MSVSEIDCDNNDDRDALDAVGQSDAEDVQLYDECNFPGLRFKALPAIQSDEIFEMDYVTDCEVLGIATSNFEVSNAANGGKAENIRYQNQDLFYLPEGLRSTTQSSLDYSGLIIEFSADVRRNFIDLHGSDFKLDEPLFSLSGLANGLVHTTMITDFVRSNGFGGRLRADSILNLLLADVYRTTLQDRSDVSQRKLAPNVIEQITEYIDTHVDEKISLDVLAAMTNTSPFHFTRLFKATTGLTPHQFVIKHRIEKAKCELLDSGKSLAETAFSVGFSSQSHFSVAFKKLVGASPGEYRRLAKT